MKKILFGLVMALVATSLYAGTVTVSVTVTNGQSIKYSDPIPVSGVLDKIEIVQTAGSTATVTIATYSGTTALETFASLTAAGGTKVIRPRVLPTDNTGTSLAAVLSASNSASTVLSVPYSRPIIGGNVIMAVTPTTGAAATNTVSATLYYEKAPLIAL